MECVWVKTSDGLKSIWSLMNVDGIQNYEANTVYEGRVIGLRGRGRLRKLMWCWKSWEIFKKEKAVQEACSRFVRTGW